MYLSRSASRARIREAQNARNNRAEIVKALSTGEVTRRELMKWGIFTAAGTLAMTNGLSPYAHSQILPSIPTGTPPSPTFGALPFTQKLPRLAEQKPYTLIPRGTGNATMLEWEGLSNEPYAKRTSWHTEFSLSGGTGYRNPLTGRGPMEGRPPGEYFAHQRWTEYLPRKGFLMSLGCPDDVGFHPKMEIQGENKLWSFGPGRLASGTLPPPLLKVRYGEPVIFRHYNNVALNKADNGGFGSISQTTHNHNGHNASTSDGASNAHFFPGQFYDYHWSTTLARADMINTLATEKMASGPDDGYGLVNVPGDYRELQSSLWFHDHRFFYTAENVYKGHIGALNYYSGKDRGYEGVIPNDTVNLRLPSGTKLPWGNTDFDVNIVLSDAATDPDGQLFFDIFDTEGFLGDLPLVNFAYKPFMEVLPRKYRFRMLCGSMSRWYKLVLVNQLGRAVPVRVIATDGNLLPAPITVSTMDTMSSGERFDIIIDFSPFRKGDRLRLVNLMEFENGRGPKGTMKLADALQQKSLDPGIGPILEFRLVDELRSVDDPTYTYSRFRWADRDQSVIPAKLTDQIPVVAPVRERIIEFKRGANDPADNEFGACFPDCPEGRENPWGMRINGVETHSLNANRVAMVVPRPGEVEHWTLVNGGGGWDHPAHLHFEEGITISRSGFALGATERLARKDVWWLGEGGSVKIQVQFGEYGGAYVTHCHNTVHEDAAMLLRYDVLTDPNDKRQSQTHVQIIPTPNPTPDGVTYVMPEILPEGNPFHRSFDPFPKG